MGTPSENLKRALEVAFEDFNHEKERRLDPISLVYPYNHPKDQEVVAFLIALLSYGNVRTIIQSGLRVLKPLGPHPYEYLISKKPLTLWPDFKHRFTTGKDIEILTHWMRGALITHSSLENLFLSFKLSPEYLMKENLSFFVKGLWKQSLPKELKFDLTQRNRNLKYLLSDPEQGSACKRLNMFLRWVVRPKDGIDLGLWGRVSPRELMLPIDTHLLKTLRRLRWVQSEQATWKTVEIATRKLREISIEDPIKYDFALCHLSMSGGNIKDYQSVKARGDR